jgi:hypothetical protein
MERFAAFLPPLARLSARGEAIDGGEVGLVY